MPTKNQSISAEQDICQQPRQFFRDLKNCGATEECKAPNPSEAQSVWKTIGKNAELLHAEKE